MVYIKPNRAHMDGLRFREQYLRVSTEVFEGTRKSVISGRMKRGGMHWSVNGANDVIALSCSEHQVRRLHGAKVRMKSLGLDKVAVRPRPHLLVRTW